ncbi:MAG: hypothetical protein M1833_001765 [Piccolia ochrophora]|nr:MAG: hypothetical protein M1833_001765 [Piccolia ochrophora]
MSGGGSLDALTKQSTDAATEFVDSYYPALQSARSSLSSFYVPASQMPDGKTSPSLVFNGNIIPDAIALQDLFEKEMPLAHFEVQSYDCHVLNPDYKVDAPAGGPPSKPSLSLLLSVSGYVRYGESREGAPRGFSESLVLVPNPDAEGGKGRGKGRRKWLVQSQSFRLVV